MGRKKLNFNPKDFSKSNAQEAGFKTKALAIKILKNTPKKNYLNFGSVNELTDYIKNQKIRLENIGIDVDSFYKQKPGTKKKYRQAFDRIEALLKQHDENKPKKFHVTAEIKRKITYTKPKKQYVYDHDSLLDSRVIEANSEKEAKEIIAAEIQEAFAQDEYSGAAAYNIDAIQD